MILLTDEERAKLVERLRLLARKGYGPSDFIGTCESAADALLAADAAVRGRREALETLDEHIGSLLKIYEYVHIPDAKDRARAKEIATAFGERCLAAAIEKATKP